MTIASLRAWDSESSPQIGPAQSVHPREVSRDQFLNHPSHTDEVTTLGKLLKVSSRKQLDASITGSEPWKLNPRYFSSVQISNLACLKILAHAVKGGSIEVMGMLIGTTVGNQIVIFDCFELPVVGTETRVNAQSESYEYMVQYMSEMVSPPLTIVGWYHSHPGYDCWLSNIDMHTQDLNQKYQDPYVGVVVDPIRSLKESKLAIGAFRTKSDETAINGDSSLQYYELRLSPFQSEFDNAFESLSSDFSMADYVPMDDSVHMGRLIDTIRQWNTFSQSSNEASALRKDQLTISNLKNKNKEEHEAEQHAHQLNLYIRQTRSNSLASMSTSGEAESDVDMNERHPEDVESLSSSSHTMTESLTPFRRQNQPLPSTLRRPWPQTLEMGFRRQVESAGGMADGPDSLQRNALLLDYDSHKREILRLKMKEYRKLRYFRDAFTL